MLKRFEAATVTGALELARERAGPGAVLVEVRRRAAGAGVVVAVATEEDELERGLRSRGVRASRRRSLLLGLAAGNLAARAAEVRSRIGRLLPIAAPSTARVLALVGPTGVGKTTTIAKLAARARLERREAVGLVTLDLYRVAAVDQLRAYADLLDVPLEVAASPAELRAALGRLRRCDRVLIDTAGRSPLDAARVDELASFLTEASEARVLLVLAANARLREMRDAIARFERCSVEGLVLTKLDEALGSGDVLELLAGSPIPLHFISAGQEVPQDLGDARAGWLADWIAL